MSLLLSPSLVFNSSLFISHYLTSRLSDLTRTLIHSTFLLVISVPPHSSLLVFHSSALVILFLLTCRHSSLPLSFPVSPFFSSIFFSFLMFSLWITPERSRNIAGCQLDERGHTGPADLVMLSHHKASLSLCLSLSFKCTHRVGSVRSHSPHACCSVMQLWSQGIPQNCHQNSSTLSDIGST